MSQSDQKSHIDVNTEGGALVQGPVHIEQGNFIGRDQNIYGYTVEEVATIIAEVRREDQPLGWDGRRPYLGLIAYQEEDAEFFFGRESLVDNLLERIRQSRFVCITGPSGSGKSSLVQAGLFHALRQGELPNSNSWLYQKLTPKGNPIEQLAQAMARLATTPVAAEYILQHGLKDPLTLHRQVETLLREDRQQRCILLVDQFEEMFTQTKDEHIRETFVSLLSSAVLAQEGRVTVLLALRSDFLSECTRYPALRSLMSQQLQLVGAMEPRELALAVTCPALAVGITMDPELVSRLIADMQGEPGALPLMQFALKDLFDAQPKQKGKPLSLTPGILNMASARGRQL